MKYKLPIAALIALIAFGTSACGASGGTDPTSTSTSPANSATAEADKPTLTESDGKLTDKDPNAQVIEGAGFDIVIDPSAKTAAFQTIDPASGEAFEDSFTYDFAAGTFVRKHYVSMMGATFFYIADAATGELISVTDAEGTDVSDTLRQRGRWDSAAADTAELKTALDTWFKDRYQMSVEEAVNS